MGVSGEDAAARTWWPAAAEYVTARSTDDVLHAVVQSSTRRRDRRYSRRIVIKRTPPQRWSVACGARPDVIVGAQAVREDGAPSGGSVVLAWPPPAKSAEGARCRDCWDATGRKRQADQWRDLKAPSDFGRDVT